MVEFLDRLFGIVMMQRFPLGSRIDDIVRFDPMTDQFGQFVKLASNPVSFAVGVGPLLGTR